MCLGRMLEILALCSPLGWLFTRLAHLLFRPRQVPPVEDGLGHTSVPQEGSQPGVPEGLHDNFAWRSLCHSHDLHTSRCSTAFACLPAPALASHWAPSQSEWPN